MKVLGRLAAVAFGVLLPLVVLEGVLKWRDLRASAANDELVRRISRVSDVPGVRFEMVPNVRTTTPGHPIVVRINRHGFRGGDVSLEKPAGTYRIVVLGDSIGFGRTLEEEDIFPSILERMLNARAPGRVEVLNASLSGRDTWEEAALLRHRIPAFEPDLVILQICMNDHVRLPYPEKGSPLGAFGERDWWSYSSLLELLGQRSPAFRRAHSTVLASLGFPRSRARVILDHFIDPRQMLDLAPNWQAWSRVLLEVRDLSRGIGAEILFVLFPIRIQSERGERETSPVLTSFAREHGIPLLDLAPIFVEDPDGLYQDHIHPTPEGNRRVAQAIARLVPLPVDRS